MLFIRMQRVLAERRFNCEPVECLSCRQSHPNYMMAIHYDNRLLCHNCSTQSPQRITTIKAAYKDYYYDLFSKLPIPDYSIAEDCLNTVSTLKGKVADLMGDIRRQIDKFQTDLEDFFAQTVIICEGYIDKIKQVENSGFEGWHKHPPKLIDQTKYIANILSKQQIASKIEESLKELKVSIPDLDHVRTQTQKSSHKVVCRQVNITSAIKVRGVLYQGTQDGRIIYDKSQGQQQIPAHQTLIRAFAHDGQFKLFSGSDDLTIKVWDLRKDPPELMQVFGTLPGIKSFHRQLVILEGGKLLASSRGQFDQYEIRIWNLQTYQNVKTLQGHKGYIRGMIALGRNKLVSVSEDRYLRVWCIGSGNIIGEYFHNSKIHYVLVSPAGTELCLIDEANRMLLMDRKTLQPINGRYFGRKISMANSESFIYVQTDRSVSVYDWSLDLLQTVDLGMSTVATNILEMGNKLVLTDAHGHTHTYYPSGLKGR